MKKRILSLALCVAMCLSLMPSAALADEGVTTDVAPAASAAASTPAPTATPEPEGEESADEAEDAEPVAEPTATAAPATEPTPEVAAEPQVDEAVQTVQALITALPAVDELTDADEAEVNAAYEAAQNAYDAYEALTDEQKAQITGADVFEALFAWFNAQISTPDDEEVVVTDAITSITTAPEDKTVGWVYGNPRGLVVSSVEIAGEYNKYEYGPNTCYQWYTVDGGLATPIGGATGNALSGLNPDAGTHTYRCVVTFRCNKDSTQYIDTRNVDFTVTVSKVTLSEGDYTDPMGWPGTYNGEEQELCTAGEVIKDGVTGKYMYRVGEDGTWSDAVPTATDAGDYTVYWYFDGGVNYESRGSAEEPAGSFQLTISPIRIEAYKITVEKTYDGKATADAAVMFKNWEDNGNDITLKAEDYTAAAKFDDANAGTDKPVTVTVTMNSGNYKLYDNGALKDTVTITQTGTINKATAYLSNDGIMPAFYVYNKLDHTYIVDFSALLPKLDTGCTYGNIAYSNAKMDTNSILTSVASCYTFGDLDTQNGTAKLTVKGLKLSGDSYLDGIGVLQVTLSVKVETDNYIINGKSSDTNTLGYKVRALNRLKPTGSPTLSVDSITYGQPLSTITLSGSMTCGDETVTGTFSWNSPTTIPPADDGKTLLYGWTFTPTDNVRYTGVTGASPVKVLPADIPADSYSVPTAISGLAYNGDPHALVTAGSFTNADNAPGTFMYKLGADGTWGETVPTAANGGDYTVYWYIKGDSNHNNVGSEAEPNSISVTVAKLPIDANEYIAPTAKTDLIYSNKDLELLNDGKFTNNADRPGTFMYKLGENGTWSENIPTGKDAGDYTVYWYLKSKDTNHADTDVQSIPVTIAKRDISEAVCNSQSYKYNGNMYKYSADVNYQPKIYVSADTTLYLDKNHDFNISGETTGTEIGTYTAVLTGKGNYTGTKKVEWIIVKGNAPKLTDITLGQRYNDVTVHTLDISAITAQMPQNAEEVSVELVSMQAVNAAAGGTIAQVESATGIAYKITGGAVGDEYEITLKVTSEKYNDASCKVKITLVDKQEQSLNIVGIGADNKLTATYGGSFTLTPVGAKTQVSYAVTSGADVVSVDANGKLTFLKAGTAQVTVTAAETEEYKSATRVISITVNKASLVVKAADRTAEIGDTAPDLSAPAVGVDYTLEGLVPGDTLNITVALNYSSKPEMTQIGEYTIVPSVIGTDDRYELSSQNGTLTVTERASFIITATAGAHGSITPVGSVSLKRGESLTFSIKPDCGYVVASVKVDGVNVGSLTSYTFTNVNAGHTIAVTFMLRNGNPQTGIPAVTDK